MGHQQLDHGQIATYVSRMKLQDLTNETFEGFVESARGIFLPKGSEIILNARITKGKGGRSLDWNDYGKGEIEPQQLTTRSFQVKQIKGSRVLRVGLGVGGIETFVTTKKMPLKFAFEERFADADQKALYVRGDNSDSEPLYESLYLRI